MEPVETPLDLTSAVSQCLASDSYAEGLTLLARSLHQVAEAARILKEGARGVEAARVRNMLSVAAKQAEILLSEEPVETLLDLTSAVTQFWKAHDEALFSQPVLTAITGLSAAYFERGRWAGYGPKFLKLGRLVRYRKADVVEWINQRPAVASTAETLPQPVGSLRGPRKKLEQARDDAKQKTAPSPRPKNARRTRSGLKPALNKIERTT